MKIGILGAGSIGATLALKLSGAGHEVKVANSRGPETIDPVVLSTGARAVPADDVVEDVEVLIISIPLNRIPAIRPLIDKLPSDATLIDTSNYYPMRDEQIPALDDGQVESLWVTEQLGRPMAKAWNAIGAGSFENKGTPAADAHRIAIPVAADRETDKAVAMRLMEDTGFDAFDSGTLAESWRQQPGAPAYCTDLSRHDMAGALSAARKEVISGRRDLAMSTMAESINNGASLTSEDLVALTRAINIENPS